MSRKIIKFEKNISLLSTASVVGKLESEGPLSGTFDLVSDDSKFGMDTWEKAEIEMVRECCETSLKKADLKRENIDLAFGGDLTNQCVSTSFGIKDHNIPFVGLYGACSTFALSLGIAASFIQAGLVETTMSFASSHFSTAERQYRFPLEYGCQRTPTAQTTVSGAGCAILKENASDIRVKEFFPGIICDLGITDANNMGAAMAPACADTLCRYFRESGKKPEDFDMIFSGDLGLEGKKIMKEISLSQNIDLRNHYDDCGTLLYDLEKQNVGAGGSGCGCSAVVFSGFINEQMKQGKLTDILLIGTGALLNPNTVLQNSSIPCIAHLIRIKKESL